jgi:hypothetical protein
MVFPSVFLAWVFLVPLPFSSRFSPPELEVQQIVFLVARIFGYGTASA